MANKRSSKYDFFHGTTSNPTNDKKTTRKKVFRIFKIILYVFLSAVTITGFAQNFTFNTSTAVGAGTEFYPNQREIAPNVATFTEQNTPVGSKSEATAFVFNESNQFVLNANEIASLRAQVDREGGNYGSFNSRTTAVRILNSANNPLGSNNGNPIFENNGNFLVKNTDQTTYNSIFSSTELLKIPFFVSPLAANGIVSPNPFSLSKVVVQDPNDPSKTSEGFQVNNLPTISELDLNSFNSNNSSLNQNDINNRKFAFDIVEALFQQTINLSAYNVSNIINNTPGFTNVPSTTQSFLSWIRSLKSNDILNETQRDLLIAYNLAISSYLNQAGFRIVAPTGTVSQTNPSQIVFDPTTSQPFAVDFTNGRPLPTSSNQIAFTNWGQAWAQGPFFGIFVFPITAITLGFLDGFPTLAGFGSILGIFFAVFIIRAISFLLTSKSVFAQIKQQELNPKKAKIDAKYAPFKGNKEMEQRHRQEVQQLYKKNNIKLSSTFTAFFISSPIFLALFKILQGIPRIKVTVFLGVNFSATSWQQLFGGHIQYLPILIVTVVTAAFSQFIPRLLIRRRMKERTNILEKQALRKSNKMQNIILVVVSFIGVLFTAGVQIYWIAGSIFTTLQSIFVHYFQKTKIYKQKLYKYV